VKSVAAFFGALLAFVVGDVLRVRREHVERGMARAGVVDPSRTARAMYRELGRGLFELLGLSLRRGSAPVAVRAPFDRVASLRADGRGVIVATAHTGNWDVAACAVARVAPLTVVTKRLSVGILDRLWQGTRRRHGVRLVTAGSASRAVADALRRGELVAMLVDQAPERARAVVRAPFLDEVAEVDLAPALCAQRAHAPLVAAFPYRTDAGAHAIAIAGEFHPPARASRRWAEETMTAVTRLLDAHVRERPAQWLWMHRRWKRAAVRTSPP